MSRECEITGAKTSFGRTYSRRGLAKAKGGVGRKVTGITKRDFKVNLQERRIWVPEIGRHVRVRLSTRALRTLTKNGAYKTLLDAGVIKPAGKKRKKAAAETSEES